MLATLVPMRSSTVSPNLPMPLRKPRMSESLSAAKTVSARGPATLTCSRRAALRSSKGSIVGSSESARTSEAMLSSTRSRSSSFAQRPALDGVVQESGCDQVLVEPFSV